MNGRNTCSAQNPWTEEKGGSWAHPDAIEIDEDYGKGGGVADGDFVRYECPHCGKLFWEELPN